MKQILLILAVVFSFNTLSTAQTMTQERTSDDLEEQVRKETKVLASELGMTDTQAKEFERNTIKFSLLVDEVLQSDITEETKTKRINDLEVQRIRATREILTKPQYDLYVKQLEARNELRKQ